MAPGNVDLIAAADGSLIHATPTSPLVGPDPVRPEARHPVIGHLDERLHFPQWRRPLSARPTRAHSSDKWRRGLDLGRFDEGQSQLGAGHQLLAPGARPLVGGGGRAMMPVPRSP